LTEEERIRLKGWKKVILYQNLISAAILTMFSIFIWIAAAQTLYPKGIKPQKEGLIVEMVLIFTSTYGEWSGLIFVICGMTALFSSIIGPFYGFSRLWEESFEKLGIYNKFKVKRTTVYRLVLIMFSILPVIFIFIVQRPMWLFSLSGLLTGPVLGLLYIIPIIVLYLDMNKTAPELKPRRYIAIFLAFLSGILMIILSLIGLG
jgi:hypothetical protein